MLHQLLSLTRPLFVLDVESTGLDVAKDRIVELAFERWDASGMTKEWRSLVNPGVPIPESATKVHHITDAQMKMCRECGFDNASHVGNASDRGHEFKSVPTFAQLAPNLAKGFSDCDYAGKNVRFDLRILSAEFARAGVEWSYLGARIVDADVLERLGDPRSLSHLVKKHLNEDMGSEAHTALGDVQWTTRLIEAQLKTYGTLPRDLDTLHAVQWPGWIDGEGKFRFVDGVPCFSGWGKYANQPMTKADVGYWDFILSKDFSADVKALASEAKLGKYPVMK